MSLVCIDEVVPQAWRNGGGRTRELLARPDPSSWNVRVSVAEIDADGPFSVFAGVLRWFAVLEGEGVELTIDGGARRVTPGSAPLQFPGAAITSCRLLAGPTLDLNLMLRDVAGNMHAVNDRADWKPSLAQCGLFSAVAGKCIANGVSTAMPRHALRWFEEAPARLRFESASPAGSNVGWWLEAGVNAGDR
jgi:environmental stress-induced protein Ves